MKEKPSREDIKLFIDIKFCGTNKTQYADQIISLYKKYVDNGIPICRECRTEMGAVSKKLIFYFDKWIKERYIEKMSGGRPHKLILNDLGVEQRLIDSYLQDRKDKSFKDKIIIMERGCTKEI